MKGAVEEKKKNKGAVVAVSDPHAPWSGKKSNVFFADLRLWSRVFIHL